MKVPFSWLKQYVDIDVTAQELEDKLFGCGFEVEELIDLGGEISKVVVGVVTECVEGFPERFAAAYLAEMQEFIDCICENRKPGVSVYDGTKSTAIGFGTTEAWKSGKVVAL